QGQSQTGQDALRGAALWRQVSTVVTLKKNMRQAADAPYADLVQRVRLGRGTTRRPVGSTERTDYEHAPILVADRQSRDSYNTRIATQAATRLGKELQFYHSYD
ncbi:hypothetical protein FA95DRAFT_1473354, partial [Auriscalpium vulgare]